MKNSVKCFVIMLGCTMLQCSGMRNRTQDLSAESQKFAEHAREIRKEAQRQNAQMDNALNIVTFGLYGYFTGSNNQSQQQGSLITDGPRSYTISNDREKEERQRQRQQYQRYSRENEDEDEDDILATAREDAKRERLGLDLDWEIERTKDLSASSKKFLWQAEKSKKTIFTILLHSITCPTTRDIVGLTGCTICCYVGIKSLLYHHENRFFGYSATFFGATGAAAKLYDLFLKE